MSHFTLTILSWIFKKLSLIVYLTAENLALRQQIIVLKRSQCRPQLQDRDRLFWVLLSRAWSGWRDALFIVQPDTVLRWHKRAFKLYWRHKSRRAKRGRPPLDRDVKELVLKMADANPRWGAPWAGPPEFMVNCSSLASNCLNGQYRDCCIGTGRNQHLRPGEPSSGITCQRLLL